MKELYLYRENLLCRFEEIVQDIQQAAGSIPDDRLHLPVEPGGLSPHQVLVHLWEIEMHALAPRLRQILDQPDPLLELFDDAGWLQANYRPEEQADRLLEAYADLRRQENTWIAEMPADGWNRTARHPWFGVRTFQWWVERCLAYSEEHLALLRKALTNPG